MQTEILQWYLIVKECTGETFDLIFTEEDLKNGVPKKEIETAKNGGNVKEVMDQALEEYIRKYLPDKL